MSSKPQMEADPNPIISIASDTPLSDRMRIFRKLRGLTQRELAKRVKRSARWMVSAESNPEQLRLADLYDLARALEVSVEELTGPTAPHPTPITLVDDDEQPSEPPADAGPYSDLSAVYTSRAAFTADVPLDGLVKDARLIRAAGLSLNMVCQQYSDQKIIALVEDGAEIQCLFLNPAGTYIKDREREEGYPTGHLSSLTQFNIDILVRLRERVSPDAQGRFQIAMYDEVPRFNILLIDDRSCVIQPYMPATRGIDSPTFVVRNSDTERTDRLFDTFERVYSWLWERRKEC